MYMYMQRKNYMHVHVRVCMCRMHLLETTPSSLPRLLSSVKWNQYKDVAVVSGHVAQLVERSI